MAEQLVATRGASTTFVRYGAYALLVGFPVAGLLLVLSLGATLHASATLTAASPAAGASVVNATLRLPIFLAQIVVVLVVSRLVGKGLRALGQPQVVGEMLAGLALGPSLLGTLAPDVYALLFPLGTVRFLNAVSLIGLVLFMFLVGLDLNPASLRGKGHAAVLTSHASIVMPMFFGALLSLILYPRLSYASVSFVTFALFVGTALSVTAFPVLARLLAEHRLDGTPFGAMAIACAAVDDVTAWCLLAAITTLAHPSASPQSLTLAFAGLVLYAIVMFTVVRRLLAWIVTRASRSGDLGQDGLAAIIAMVFVSAWITDRLGVHPLFGAFMAGVVMPKDVDVIQSLRGRSEDLLLVLLLPLFFVATGIRTRVGLISGSGLLLALTVFVAVAGKLGGSAIAARTAGLPWRESLALGSLLNARGLIGLVVVNVGLEIGVISPTLYAILVLTAVVTTFMASPMVELFYPRGAAHSPASS